MENGFGEYRREILYRLDSIEEKMDDLNSRFEKLEKEFLMHRVKASLWGAAAGSLPVALGILYQLVK